MTSTLPDSRNVSHIHRGCPKRQKAQTKAERRWESSPLRGIDAEAIASNRGVLRIHLFANAQAVFDRSWLLKSSLLAIEADAIAAIRGPFWIESSAIDQTMLLKFRDWKSEIRGIAYDDIAARRGL